MRGVVDNKSGIEYTGFDEIDLNNQGHSSGLTKYNNSSNTKASNDKKLRTHHDLDD